MNKRIRVKSYRRNGKTVKGHMKVIKVKASKK